MGKTEGKRPLGRPRRRRVDNIRTDLGEVRWGDVNWIGLAQDRNRWRTLVSSLLNLRVPRHAGKCWAIINIIREGVMIIYNHCVGRSVNTCSETVD
jgi:hypothetical protein